MLGNTPSRNAKTQAIKVNGSFFNLELLSFISISNAPVSLLKCNYQTKNHNCSLSLLADI